MLVFKDNISKFLIFIMLLCAVLFAPAESKANLPRCTYLGIEVDPSWVVTNGNCKNAFSPSCDQVWGTEQGTVSIPSNQSYLNPTITVDGLFCLLNLCSCGEITLPVTGNNCDWVYIFGSLHRVCARTVAPNTHVTGYTNNNDYAQICVFLDPTDSGDNPYNTSGSSSMPYHYQQSGTICNGVLCNQLVWNGTNGLDSPGEGTPIGCIHYPPGPPPPAYPAKLPATTPSLIAERVCNKGESPILYSDPTKRCVMTSLATNGASVSNNSFETNLIRVGYGYNIPLCTASLTTGCINISYGSNNGDIKSLPTNNNDLVNSLITQCSDAGTKPCINFSIDIPVTNIPTGPYRLSYTYPNTNNTTPTNYYNPIIPQCSAQYPTGCVTFKNQGATNSPIYQCNDSTHVPAASDLCVTFTLDVDPAMTTSGSTYTLTGTSGNYTGAILKTASSVDIQPVLSGINIGNYQDLAFRFNSAFTDNNISQTNLLNVYGLGNSYVTGDNIINPYLLKIFYPYNNVNDFSVFAYIDTDNPTMISAYQAGLTTQTLLNSYPRAPITDIKVSAPSTTSTNIAPMMNVSIGASPYALSKDVWNTGSSSGTNDGTITGALCNNNWTTPCKVPTKTGIYLHGINVNNIIPAQSTAIFSPTPTYTDYITSIINNNVSNNAINGLSPGFSSPGPFVVNIGTTPQINLASLNTCSSLGYSTTKQPSYSTGLSGVAIYDCSGFANNSPSITNTGYLAGIEFLNGKYLRGADTLCLDTSSFNNLIPNSSVLSTANNGIANTLQVARLAPAASASLPLAPTSYYANPPTPSTPPNNICYPSGTTRSFPSCPTDSCCNSCVTNNCTSSQVATISDLSYQMNATTETQRPKLPWELPSLSVGNPAGGSLCLSLSAANGGVATPCNNQLESFANWNYTAGGTTPAGQTVTAGTPPCLNTYYLPSGDQNPTATCYPMGNAGAWNIKDSCTIAKCSTPSGSPIHDTTNHVTWPVSNAGINNVSGTCDYGYSGPIYGKCTQDSQGSSTASWSIASGSCATVPCLTNYANANWPTSYVSSTAITGTCSAGYIGTITGTCTQAQSGVSTTGTWSTTGTCASGCSATTAYGNASWNQIASGSTQNGTCKSGYKNASGGSPTMQCNSGSWSGTVTNSCILSSSCNNNSANLSHATFTTSGSTLNGNTITGTCNPGYYSSNSTGGCSSQISSPSPQARCNNGTFTYTNDCSKNSCPSGNIDGDYQGYKCSSTGNTHHCTPSIYCANSALEGYHQSSGCGCSGNAVSNNFTCNSNGSWSH